MCVSEFEILSSYTYITAIHVCMQYVCMYVFLYKKLTLDYNCNAHWHVMHIMILKLSNVQS